MSGSMAQAAELRPIQLPAPERQYDSSLFTALERRQTIRDISAKALPLPLLSSLLWAAWGVNREVGPFGLAGRTAASASNSQEIELYAALAQGLYRYEAGLHRLVPIVAGDHRGSAMTPRQRNVEATAPVQLIYTVDLDRLVHTRGFQEPGLQDWEVQKSYYFVDTGLIASNVYLFAAANGLAAWFHNCDKAGLAQRLGFGPRQKVLFAQSVGYPARDETGV